MYRANALAPNARLVIAAFVVVSAAAAGAVWVAWWPAIDAIPPPARTAFAPEAVARGAVLAAIGDCAVCHTAAGGQPYAGGRAVPTPFGAVIATNITPDQQTGIGNWSLAAFRRAMRAGISRDGAHLYPVLPYPHFTRATDADISALYAFLMTRTAEIAPAPPNKLPFPFNQRVILAGWDVLFLRPGPFQPDPDKDAAWNRGAYLAEAVGHCGACHTPHNFLGAERAGERFAGGAAEGWQAPALQQQSPAPRIWTEASIATYLRTGFDAAHGAAAGPMAPVTYELESVPDSDVRALAVYFAAQLPPAPPDFSPAASPPRALDSTAAELFGGACGACHAADAPMRRGGAPSLALSTAVNAPAPRDVIKIILRGLPMREGRAGPYMPGFADALTDDQVAALTSYVRARYSTRPPWSDIAENVRDARKSEGGP